jgi:hypothetical protein
MTVPLIQVLFFSNPVCGIQSDFPIGEAFGVQKEMVLLIQVKTRQAP